MTQRRRHQRPHRRRYSKRIGTFQAGKRRGRTLASQHEYSVPVRYFDTSKQDVFSGKTLLTEQEVLLLKRRLNHGQLKIGQVHFPEDGFRLTQAQTQKGYDWLMNQWKTPRGIERLNNPFGYREQSALENFKEFRLIDFYDAANSYAVSMGIHNYQPYYRVVGKGDNPDFEYTMYGGEIHILG